MVVDHNDALLARAKAEFPGVTVLPNAHAQGLSGARNTGIEAGTGDVVGFLDDDAAAEPAWAARLSPPTRTRRARRRRRRRPDLGDRGAAWCPRSSTGSSAAPTGACRPAGSGPQPDRRQHVVPAHGPRRGRRLRQRARPPGRQRRAARRPSSASAPTSYPDGVIVFEPAAASTTGCPPPGHLALLRRPLPGRGRVQGPDVAHRGQSAALSAETTYVTRTLPTGVAANVLARCAATCPASTRAAAIVAGCR